MRVSPPQAVLLSLHAPHAHYLGQPDAYDAEQLKLECGRVLPCLLPFHPI